MLKLTILGQRRCNTAWIESHQSLGTHRKLMRLIKILRIKDIEGIGLLHYLWWWSLDNAPDGDITDLSAEEIAEVAHWRGDPDRFLQALVDAHWVEKTSDGKYLHDWEDYAGKLLDKRRSNAERQKAYRQTRRNILRNTNVTTTSLSRNGATVPNSTVPNSTVPITTTPTPSSPGPDVVVVDKPEELNVFKVYEQEIGELTPIIAEELKAAEKEFESAKIIDAIKKASLANKKSWRYIAGILENWRADKAENIFARWGGRQAVTNQLARKLNISSGEAREKVDALTESSDLSGLQALIEQARSP